ncbi:hypothetical protein BJ912DRAFT_650250 [Pholiota molesta]|nr:hypothetical protein BJ912DRAFT_650250 [Pholiota molesta]
MEWSLDARPLTRTSPIAHRASCTYLMPWPRSHFLTRHTQLWLLRCEPMKPTRPRNERAAQGITGLGRCGKLRILGRRTWAYGIAGVWCIWTMGCVSFVFSSCFYYDDDYIALAWALFYLSKTRMVLVIVRLKREIEAVTAFGRPALTFLRHNTALFDNSFLSFSRALLVRCSPGGNSDGRISVFLLLQQSPFYRSGKFPECGDVTVGESGLYLVDAVKFAEYPSLLRRHNTSSRFHIIV